MNGRVPSDLDGSARRSSAHEGKRPAACGILHESRAAFGAPRLIGILVGATGGLVFVFANAHSPLDAAASVTLRILAATILIALVALGVFVRHSSHDRDAPERRDVKQQESSWFGRGFWLIVAGEFVLFQAGFQLLRVSGSPPESRVAWIAVVVGVHFVAFARLWREPSLALLGAILTVLGIAGLAMSSTSAVDWAPFVSGVVSGFVLLTGSLAAVIGEKLLEKRLSAAAPGPVFRNGP